MEELATHRELAQWCAQGKGEWKHLPSHSGAVYTACKYNKNLADCCIIEAQTPGQLVVVRRGGDNENKKGCNRNNK